MHRIRLVLVAVALLSIAGACGSSPSKGAAGFSTRRDPKVWTDGTASCPVTGKPAARVGGTTPAPEGIPGVLAFSTQPQDQVAGCVDYPVSPPVGGSFNAVWATCGFYASAVPNELAVHSLATGAVWIAFGTGVGAAALRAIQTQADTSPYVLASPYPGLGSTVVLSAWGRQLTLRSVSDPRFSRFLTTYLEAQTAPDRGATCQGGMGAPA